jgi:hypothetical protein
VSLACLRFRFVNALCDVAGFSPPYVLPLILFTCAQILEPAGRGLRRAIMSLLALPLALSSSNASLVGLLVLLVFFGSAIPVGFEFLTAFPFALLSYAVFYGIAVPCSERC